MPTVPVDEALARILETAVPLGGAETVATHGACGRVLAADVLAGCDLPPHDASAMDGYALRAADAARGGLPVAGRVAAGAAGGELAPGTAVRIFTGAPVPRGADTVVRQESCWFDERGLLHVDEPPAPGGHLRRAGESVRSGATVLRVGHRLRPQDLALAASVGAASLIVSRPLRAAVIATGRELAPPGTPLAPGQVFDANRAQLHALLGALGCEVRLAPAVGDDAAQTRAAIAHAARDSDLVITSGGVGVGDEDHVRAAVEALGEVRLQGVAMKPGKPLLFGRAGSADLFGLPGNPAALLVGFCLFVRPFVLRRLGVAAAAPRAFPVRAGFEAPAAAGRRGYLMAGLEPAPGGGWSCRTHPDGSSGALAAAAWADGLAVVPEGTRVVPGDTVGFLPFRELLG